MKKIKPVILAGGNGSRLWPLSRTLRPKQFLNLINDSSMLQNTMQRLSHINNIEAPIIICNEEHRFLAAEQMRALGLEHTKIILEPSGRDTAPAIAIASLYAQENYGDDVLLLILAADHDIQDEHAFKDAVHTAAERAIEGDILTFGIVANTPHTGYGYIKTEETDKSSSIRKVSSFEEKPNLEKAQNYVASGQYFWNSGMFLFKPSTMIKELETFDHSLFKSCSEALHRSEQDFDFIRLPKKEFDTCKAISIDYCVMEKSNKVSLVPLSANWSDVGDWSSLWAIGDKDADNNVCVGDVIARDSRNSYIRANQKLVATLGVDNLVVVETKDAVLVSSKDCVQDIKSIVTTLQEQGRYESKHHRHVYRPWGYYDSIDNGSRFQVKRIVVKPGAKLSVQMHHHRAEHWVVVKGTALVTCGDKVSLLSENESTYIPLGVVHALENPGKIELEIIEVQTGGYLGEDDIIRFEDKYGRSGTLNEELSPEIKQARHITQQSKQAAVSVEVKENV